MTNFGYLITLIAIADVVLLVVLLIMRHRNRMLRGLVAVAFERAEKLQAQLSKFDHDGDGRPGGSKPRARSSK